MRVMTFNLRRDVEHDGPNAWVHRRDAVANVIRRHRPAVLGTQEGLPHQLVDLDERLPEYGRVGGCRRGDGLEEHNAIFYDKARFEVESWGDYWLSLSPSVAGSASWGNALPRIVTWARLRERDTGDVRVVANTHLDHRSEVSRRQSAALLASLLPGAVLMGDFNAEPGDAVHDAFRQAGWQDAWLSCGRPEEGTFHGFSQRLRARLDWVLVPEGARVLACRALRERPGGAYPSDHDPVLAELVLPAQPAVAAARALVVEE